MPENVQLAETLFEERTADEWKVIRHEIESELRVKIPLLPSNIGKIFQDLMELSSKSPELKELQDQTIKIREPEAKLMEALMKNVASGVELLDQIYRTAADKLFDHMITGRPIELPAHLLVT